MNILNKIENIYYNIKDLYHKIEDICCNIKYGIRNLIRWIPVIWRDKNYHYIFIYYILYYKFKYMEQFFNSNKCYIANAEHRAKQVKIAKVLCKRLYENNYLDNAMIIYNQMYPHISTENMIKYNQLKASNKQSLIDNNFKDDYHRGHIIFINCIKHSDYMEQQDKKYLFRHMCKYMGYWWD